MKWQPIDTVPADLKNETTEIVVWSFSGMRTAKWMRGAWVTVPGEYPIKASMWLDGIPNPTPFDRVYPHRREETK